MTSRELLALLLIVSTGCCRERSTLPKPLPHAESGWGLERPRSRLFQETGPATECDFFQTGAMVVLALLATVLLAQHVPCGSEDIPKEHSAFLKEIREIGGYDPAFDGLPESDTPHHQDGIIITNSGKTMVPQNNADCAPRLTAVDIRGDRHLSTMLLKVTSVLLHRCAGAVSIFLQQTSKCVVVAAEEVNVTVYDYMTRKDLTLTVLNHTKCGRDCIVQESHCDKSKHVYNKAICACDCIESPNCNAKQVWNDAECRCDCSGPPDLCTANHGKEEWNTQTCECDCVDFIKKKCVFEGKDLDRASCSCVCSANIICQSGQSVNPSTCRCE